MGVLVWLVVGSAVLLTALLLLAVVCACVLASRADDVLEAGELGPVLVGVDDVRFDWPERAA